MALAITGCSIGPIGKQGGDVSLTVTRDFGARQIVHVAQKDFPKDETVMRYTQRYAPKVKTRYGGRFVESIDGLAADVTDDQRNDWFYYVNGIEVDTGASERKLDAGDHVWWDYHDWDATMRIPAVVGSYPEPFLHGADGRRYPVRVDCGESSDDACNLVEKKLDQVGVPGSKAAIGSVTGQEVARLVVGTWDEVRKDGAAHQIEDGPKRSGVFARPVELGDGFAFELIDQRGNTVRTLGPGGGLVAATRFEKQAPTWVVTGTDSAGLNNAVSLLTSATLRNRFAVATDGKPIDLPVEKSAQ